MSTVLITGSNSGFGAAACLSFARGGDRVYASMRDPSRGEQLLQTAAQEKLDIRPCQLDVTDSSGFQPVIDKILAESGGLDILVNNAGILLPGALEDLTEAQLNRVMATNCIGALLLTRAVLPVMRDQRSGYIIMLSSLSGIAGLAGDVAYTASKFALEGATEALRHEVDRWGIKVALVQAARAATAVFGDSDALPADYPTDSPYRALVEAKIAANHDGLADALPPQVIGDLLTRIAASDGSTLRWPGDELSERVLGAMLGQSDTQRDEFLRGAGGTDWWSHGQDGPA